jgi:hypothetical protein
MLDETGTNVRWNGGTRWTKWGRMLDKMVTNVRWNGDEGWMERRQMLDETMTNSGRNCDCHWTERCNYRQMELHRTKMNTTPKRNVNYVLTEWRLR